MGNPVVTSQTQVNCGHAGVGSHVPTQARVRVAGSPVALASDQHAVAGCGLSGSGSAPCVTLTWTAPASRVRVDGQPVLVQTSQPLAVGPGIVLPGQARVLAI